MGGVVNRCSCKLRVDSLIYNRYVIPCIVLSVCRIVLVNSNIIIHEHYKYIYYHDNIHVFTCINCNSYIFNNICNSNWFFNIFIFYLKRCGMKMNYVIKPLYLITYTGALWYTQYVYVDWYSKCNTLMKCMLRNTVILSTGCMLVTTCGVIFSVFSIHVHFRYDSLEDHSFVKFVIFGK